MNEVLDTDPLNFQALYLRGKAYYDLNEVGRAYGDFLQALEIQPQNQLIQKYVNEI